jgi:hypothetical protein
MNIWGLSALGRAPHRLWRHLQKWRAHRLCLRVVRRNRAMQHLYELNQRDYKTAQRLWGSNVEDPQKKLPGIE